jgi:hypothetical protein
MSKCVGSRNLKHGAAYTRVRLLCHRNKLLDQPVIYQSGNFLHLLELIGCLCYMLPAERFLFLYDGLDFLLSGFSVLSCIPVAHCVLTSLPPHSLSPFIQKFETQHYLICVSYCITIYVSTIIVIPKSNSLCLSLYVINNLLLLAVPTEN